MPNIEPGLLENAFSLEVKNFFRRHHGAMNAKNRALRVLNDEIVGIHLSPTLGWLWPSFDPIRSYLSGRKKVKHLVELKMSSISMLSAGRRSSSAIAPTKQHQFSTSCWPVSSIAAKG